MRLLRLDLLRFGPFTDTVLELDGGSEGLHIVYGPNEAGKTSALRAVRQLLYGIPHNSPDNFRHDHQQLRVGALLGNGDGGELECIRRKGRTNTLRAADDSTLLDPEMLDRLLGGLSEQLFVQMFGIDHPMLVQGGREIVEGRGEIGQMLFAAGAGISDLRSIQQQLEQESDALFKLRGSVPKINSILSELNDSRKAVRDAQLPSKSWVEHDQAWRNSIARKETVDRELSELTGRRRHLQRLHDASPGVGARKRLQAELSALANVPVLRKDFTAQRVDAQLRLSQAEIAERQAQQAIEQLDAALADIEVPQLILDHSKEIEQLQKDLGSHLKAMRDRPERDVEHRQLLSAADNTLKNLRPEVAIESAEQLRLTGAEHVRITNLGARQESLAKHCRDTQAKVAEIRRQLDQAKVRLSGLPAVRDASELRKAIGRIQKQGPLEDQLAQLHEQLGKQRRQAVADLAKLGLWSGELDAIEALPVPALESIDHCVDRVQSVETEQKALRARRAEEQTSAAESDAELEQLRLEQEVPTEEELADARRVRDEGFQLVRRAWLDKETSPSDESAYIADFPPAQDLAEAYSAAVERADQLADRLRREARRVAKQAQLLARQRQQTLRITQLDDQIAALNADLAADAQRWNTLWSACGIVPQSPREMRAWWQRHASLAATSRECSQLQSSIDHLSKPIATAKRELSQQLRELGETAPESESLLTVLERGMELIAAVDQSENARAEVQREIARLDLELPQALADSQAAEVELADWRKQWTASMHRLGLAEDALAAEANAVLKGLTDLFQVLEKAGGLRHRIDDIDRDAAEFAARVRELTGRIAPDVASMPAEVAAAEFNTRLTRARAANLQYRNLHERRESEVASRRTARQTMDSMQVVLTACCREARCDQVEGLSGMEERSAGKQELLKELRAVEQQLLKHAGGATIDELALQVESLDADQLAGQISQLDDQIAAISTEREKLLGLISSEKTLLDQMDGSATAAEAAERGQSLLAGLRSHVEHYARTRLASAVLRKAIERYREKHQDPILARASDLFAELTVGAFDGLRAEIHEKGHPILVGVRSATSEHVGVECMSEGTADQLYLALRLASLERYLDHKEPVPFVVDDILVQFDNERSAATLQALARLSRRTQVIFFTHHEHLLDLAERHLDAGDWFVHRLPSRRAAQVAGA